MSEKNKILITAEGTPCFDQFSGLFLSENPGATWTDAIVAHEALIKFVKENKPSQTVDCTDFLVFD